MINGNILQRSKKALRMQQPSSKQVLASKGSEWLRWNGNSPGAGGSFVNFTTILPSLDNLRASMERGKRSMIYEKKWWSTCMSIVTRSKFVVAISTDMKQRHYGLHQRTVAFSRGSSLKPFPCNINRSRILRPRPEIMIGRVITYLGQDF